MKKLVLLLLGFGFLFSLAACTSEEPSTDSNTDTDSDTGSTSSRTEVYDGPELVIACDQKNERAVIYDLRQSELDGNELWEFAPRRGSCVNISGVKYRNNAVLGEVVVLCASGGYAGIVTYPGKEVLWQTDSAGNNPHSVELLPNGNLAVASSSGSTVRLYASSQTGADASRYIEVELYGAHGVLWDPTLEVLWALGNYDLIAYRVGGTDAKPTLTEDTVLSTRLPTMWGHDLAPVYGDSDRLWVTTDSHVYQFVKSTGAFERNYAGNRRISKSSVKGVGNFPESGAVALVAPDGTYREWNTSVIQYVRIQQSENGTVQTETETRTTKQSAYYKVRVFCSDYQ